MVQKSPLRNWTAECVNYHSEGFGRYRSHWEVVIQIWGAIAISLPLKLPQTRTGTWLCPGSCLGSPILPPGSIGRKGRKMGEGNNYFLGKKHEFWTHKSSMNQAPSLAFLHPVLLNFPCKGSMWARCSWAFGTRGCVNITLGLHTNSYRHGSPLQNSQESSSITSPGEWHWAHFLQTLEFSEVWESRQPWNVPERLCVKVCPPISSICKGMSLDHLEDVEEETPRTGESRKCAQFLCKHSPNSEDQL